MWKYDIPKENVKGHRDWSPDLDGDGVIEKHEWLKDCPCFEVSEFMENV
jgi:N-acetylmuramoyl-L-alanine amidase